MIAEWLLPRTKIKIEFPMVKRKKKQVGPKGNFRECMAVRLSQLTAIGSQSIGKVYIPSGRNWLELTYQGNDWGIYLS